MNDTHTAETPRPTPAADGDEVLFTHSNDVFGYILDPTIPYHVDEIGAVTHYADLMYRIKLLARPGDGLDTLTWPVDATFGAGMLQAILVHLQQARQ